jgi:hypothetical protein
LDPFFGKLRDPLSLHKYLYAHAEPVSHVDPSGKFVSLSIASLFSSLPRVQHALNSVQVGLDAASFYTGVAAATLWGMRYALEGPGGRDNRWDARVLSLSFSVQVALGEFGSTLFDALGIGTSIPITAGAGRAYNWDFLLMEDGFVYQYVSKGWSLGTQGAGVSVELGRVDSVATPADYEGGFLALTGSLQKGIASAFAAGIAGTAFVSLPGLLSGAWGYSVGIAGSTARGFGYVTTWTEYSLVRDAVGNPVRFPISSVPFLATLPKDGADAHELQSFVAANRGAILGVFADHITSLALALT